MAHLARRDVTGAHERAGEHGQDAVALGEVVLVPRQDEEPARTERGEPLRHVRGQPVVAHARAGRRVVRVVSQVRDHEQERGHRIGADGALEVGKRARARGVEVRPVRPRRMLARVEPRVAHGGPGRGQILAVGVPREALRLAGVPEVLARERRSFRRHAVVGHAHGRARPQGEVVGLRRVPHRVSVREYGTLGDEPGGERLRARPVVALVLHHDDEHVIEVRHPDRRGRRRPARGRPPRRGADERAGPHEDPHGENGEGDRHEGRAAGRSGGGHGRSLRHAGPRFKPRDVAPRGVYTCVPIGSAPARVRCPHCEDPR